MPKGNKKSNSHFDFIDTKVNIAKSKRSQVTLFIIIAIIIVAAVIGFFVFFKPSFKPAPQIESPEAYIESCMKDAAKDAIDILDIQGGDINPINYFNYQNKKVRYLCYTNLNYEKCTNQEPMLKQHIESEITNYAMPALKECVSSIKKDFEKRGYAVETSTDNILLKTSIQPENVVIDAEFEFSASKGEEKIKSDKFESILKEQLYSLIGLSSEIINQEITWGNFNIDGYMMLYPKHKVERDKVNEIKIYTLTERATQRQFRFAVRGYVLPAGI
ncbi:hypothetical protein HYT26_00450 [Candidatus Pacearchaeota archaeon]|nr:hypothetical protein [Candidatus Pacearchaeota archaeon]